LKKGVTLIEILVAVLLLAISIAPLLSVIGSYYKESVNKSKTQAAALIIDSEMERIRKDNTPGGRMGLHKEEIDATHQIKDYIGGNNGNFNKPNSDKIPGYSWEINGFSLDSTLQNEKFYVDYDTMNIFPNNPNINVGNELTDLSILQVKVRVRWNKGGNSFIMTTYTR